MSMPEEAPRITKTKLTLALVLAAMVIVFTLQNTEVVEVKFLFWSLSLSRVLMIFSLLVVGMVLGWLLRGWAQPGATSNDS